MDLVAGPDVIEQFDDEKRDQQDSQDGDFVGGRHAPNISLTRTPSQTFVTSPVMRIEKSSPTSMAMIPPGIWTEISRSHNRSLYATAAAALLLLPLASV